MSEKIVGPGDVVHYYRREPDSSVKGPLAAIVTRVWGRDMVNLAVWGQDGITFPATSIVLMPEGVKDSPHGAWAVWPERRAQWAPDAAERRAQEIALRVFDAAPTDRAGPPKFKTAQEKAADEDSPGPKVTKASIESKIINESYIHQGKMTFCVLTLENGFIVSGHSACVDPKNYDVKLGDKYAREAAIDKMWELEGYLLQEKLSKAKGENLNFGDAIWLLKEGKKVCRAGWNGKGMYLLYMHGGTWKLPTVTLEGQPWIGMKTANDTFVPWLASQSDVLASDWQIVS